MIHSLVNVGGYTFIPQLSPYWRIVAGQFRCDFVVVLMEYLVIEKNFEAFIGYLIALFSLRKGIGKAKHLFKELRSQPTSEKKNKNIRWDVAQFYPIS
ncbi:hypothetical protein ACO0KY_13205 [Undibacterium sp. Dicai25W]|uniref:hypothetical protein n=1 Tax=Undibacterium sp. Dicai25W TaxID=3413034 RepID=UPI003BF06263